MIEHILRGPAHTADFHCRLAPEGLEIRGGTRQSIVIPYQTIREVNLQSFGRLAGVARFRCGIRSWEHRQVVLDNMGFKGHNDSDAGDAAYRRFVVRLHRILKQQEIATRFTRGSTGLGLIGWCLIGLIVLASAGALLGLGVKGLWLVGCMAAATPYGFFLIHNHRREEYTPDGIPMELLPATESTAERTPAAGNPRRRAEVAC